MLSEWVSKALGKFGFSQAELSRRLTERLNRRIDAAAVNKILSRQRALAADEMLAISEISGYPPPISLEGDLAVINCDLGFNEEHLIRLMGFALEWKGGMPLDQGFQLAASLLGASRRRPSQPDAELTDEQLRQIALGLADGSVPRRLR